ncbi:MAG TPA: DUF1499 domain-containing protein [Methylococcus sp.]|nr:DUF1499 domain-containing protein [Methylococcus sp.]
MGRFGWMGGVLFLLGWVLMAEGRAQARIGDCPSSPNCVSSRASDASHRIAPFRFRGPVAEVRDALIAVLEAEGMRVVQREQDYLRAEAVSRVFRFVDDVEFEILPEEGSIQVRSASRVGYWDFGVNRRRIERIRDALRRRGIIE